MITKHRANATNQALRVLGNGARQTIVGNVPAVMTYNRKDRIMMSYIEELTQKIIHHNVAYANGIPYITDTEYDKLWRELHDVDPHNPNLYHTTKSMECRIGHLKHKRILYGLNKAFCADDIKPFRVRHGAKSWKIEPKYDGVAAVRYLNPDGSYHLVLSGNGTTGADVTHHMPAINFDMLDDTQVISPCELVIKNEHWNPSLGANQRNTVAGMINSHTIENKTIITAIPHVNGLNDLIPEPSMMSLDQIEEKLLVNYHKWSSIYPMDGLVIKLSDETEQLKAGHNGTTNHWSLAWKPPISTEETTVTDIEWNVSRNGRIIPTVIYDPIELCGTTNTRVTGNNAQWMLTHKVAKESKIVVGKAGEIIPKIMEVKEHLWNVRIPGECPYCGFPTIWEGVHIVCNGEHCLPKLIKRIAHFYSAKCMDVKGIGESMIELLLVESAILKEVLTNHPYALLTPEAYKIGSEILHIWGIKRTNNYLNELELISGKRNPAHFISGLGYKNMAYKTCYSIAQNMLNGGNEKIKKLKMSSFIDGLLTFNRFVELTKYKYIPISDKLQIKYCITGELSQHRNDLIAYLSNYDWQFTNQVSKKTEYLILGSLPKESTKLHKAKSIGTKIISEQDLYDLLPKKEDENERIRKDQHVDRD